MTPRYLAPCLILSLLAAGVALLPVIAIAASVPSWDMRLLRFKPAGVLPNEILGQALEFEPSPDTSWNPFSLAWGTRSMRVRPASVND
jgi:hypothetical protein